MKLFQKSALAVAIAAVPFLSVNAMEALDDATLSEMTGQAGVTIETTVDGTQGITIGEIIYTDTLSSGAAAGDGEIGGGSVAITSNGGGFGVKIQGLVNDGNGNWTEGNATTKQKIDVDIHGNLITSTEAVGAVGVVGGVMERAVVGGDGNSIGVQRVTAQKISVGQVLLRSAAQQEFNNGAGAGGAQLVSDLVMTMESGDSSAHIINLQGADSAERATARDLYLNSGTGGSLPVAGAATPLTGVEGGLNKAVAAGANIAIVTKGSSRISDLSVNALDGAIGIEDMSYGGGADGQSLMESTQVIWAVSGDALASGSKAGVYIQGSDSTGTLTIGKLNIGEQNIGRIQIRNINQAGSVTRIYGH